ncbi:MAG: hypothetical protein JWN34_5312 [Bryobacterales bacterium]|nr:hypothetical protein [Bryobacterales bacterium]
MPHYGEGGAGFQEASEVFRDSRMPTLTVFIACVLNVRRMCLLYGIASDRSGEHSGGLNHFARPSFGIGDQVAGRAGGLQKSEEDLVASGAWSNDLGAGGRATRPW